MQRVMEKMNKLCKVPLAKAVHKAWLFFIHIFEEVDHDRCPFVEKKPATKNGQKPFAFFRYSGKKIARKKGALLECRVSFLLVEEYYISKPVYFFAFILPLVISVSW